MEDINYPSGLPLLTQALFNRTLTPTSPNAEPTDDCVLTCAQVSSLQNLCFYVHFVHYSPGLSFREKTEVSIQNCLILVFLKNKPFAFVIAFEWL
jgi:hypothetical protein